MTSDKHRQHSVVDKLFINADKMLRTLSPGSSPVPVRQSPAKEVSETDLTEAEKKHAAGLMRVNHTGEVMAQALYQGQALTARLDKVRGKMEQAAAEEEDHLAWCEERVKQLGSHTSLTNPLWYGVSFGMGACAGIVGDKVSLGFVAAIEDQVCEHLKSHLQQLPGEDDKSREIVKQMLEDEAHHSETAKAAGGVQFPMPVQKGMTLMSKLMTKTAYKI